MMTSDLTGEALDRPRPATCPPLWESVEACVAALRQMRASKIQVIQLVELVLQAESVGPWIRAVQQLRRAGELADAEAAFLLKEFIESPPNSVVATDPRVVELNRAIRNYCDALGVEDMPPDLATPGYIELETQWASVRQDALAACLRQYGEHHLADLAAAGAIESIVREGRHSLRGSDQIDLSAAPLFGQEGNAQLPHDELSRLTVSAIKELRAFVESDAGDLLDLVVRDDNIGTIETWFYAIKCARMGLLISGPASAALLDAFLSFAPDSPLEIDQALADVRGQALHLMLSTRTKPSQNPAFQELRRRQKTSERALKAACYGQQGEYALAQLTEAAPEQYERLCARGRRELERGEA